MKGLIRDGVARTVRLDANTGTITTVDHEHHKCHSGSAYSATQRTAADAFDIAAPLLFHVTTPDTTKWIHLIISGEANTAAYLEIFEDDGNASHFDISGGSAYTPLNKNRNSSNASGITLKTGVTVTQATSDVLIFSVAMGRNSARRGQQEFILKQNTEYLIRATSYADNNEGSLSMDWYEHTARD